MASQEYVIRGKLTASMPSPKFDDLAVMAYEPHSLSSMQVFGTCPVDANGKFELSFERGSAGSRPSDVHIMVVPEAIAQFGVLHINMSVLKSFAPSKHIAAGDWTTNGVYRVTVTIAISNLMWKLWDWLSEEFTVIGRVVKRVGDARLPIPFAWVGAADADMPRPYGSGVGMAETDEWGNFTITFRRKDFFIDFANYIAGRGYGTEYWPDLIFNVTQSIGGTKTRIYQETEHDARPQAAWNVPRRLLYVTLVTEEGVTHDEIYPPIPAGDNFLCHGIGVVDPHAISDGYATTGPADDLRNVKDAPFGGSLHIKGQFDTAGPNPPRYYQVLYARWDGATAPDLADFTPVLNESWTVSTYDTGAGTWDPLVVEPISGILPDGKVYEIPDYSDITRTKKTRLIRWTTTRRDAGVPRYPDGKYDLLVKAWDASGAPVDLNPSHPEDNRLTVVIDNQRPKALLKRMGPFDILRTDEMQPYTPVCPVFSKSALGTLRIEFDATDENQHFRSYHLSFITGHNFKVDQMVRVYDGPSGADERFRVIERHRTIGTGTVSTTHRPDEVKPPGGFPNEAVDWDISSADVVKCAYQVRLGVRDRTINGYHHIHYAEDTMHFSIEK